MKATIALLGRQKKTSGRALPEVLEVYITSMLKFSFSGYFKAAQDLNGAVTSPEARIYKYADASPASWSNHALSAAYPLPCPELRQILAKPCELPGHVIKLLSVHT
jgi:hypothetical protein